MSADVPITEPASPPPSSEVDPRQLQAVLDALPVPIFFKNRAGAYLGCNAAFEAFLGLPRERIVGRSVFDVAPRDLADVYQRADDALLRTGGRQVYESRVQWADGTRRDVVFHKAVLHGAGGEPVGVVGAMLDVTAQHEAERARNTALESARISQRLAALGTLAAGVAHELTTPLTFVLTNLELATEALRRIRDAPAAPADLGEAAHALDDAVEGAQQMRAILQDLRTLSRDDDQIDEPADVRTLLEQAAALASNEIMPRARLVWDVADVPPVRGGEGRLRQVLVNLLLNAAHATPEGAPAGRVIALSAARRPDDRVCITVRDEGAGIAPEHLPKVFDPFFTTKPVGVGTGLGLWVCQSIVNAAGGAIEVESEVGRGTTFRVILAAAAGDAGRGRARRHAAELRRVLVVDEEPLVAATMRRQLASEYRVEAASGSADALARLRAAKYDAVICDVMMPGARSLVDGIRATAPELAARVLFVSAGAPPAVAEWLAGSGAKVLPKPFGARQLREAVRELVAR